LSTSGSTDINSGSANNFTAGANTNISSGGQHIESASKIHMNGPPATPATPATPASPLSTHANPVTSTGSGWGNKKRYQAGTTKSIMKRIPMHEPWSLHENFAPTVLKPTNTDRDT
jgi:hypothetical protein